MRTSLIAIALIVVGLSVPSYAAPSAKGNKSSGTWASGQVERYDASSKTLVLKQGAHEMTFVLAPDAKVSVGKKSVEPTDLANEVGHKAKVHYTAGAGTKTAHQVALAESSASATKHHATK